MDYKNRMFVVPLPKDASAHEASTRPRQQSQEHILFPVILVILSAAKNLKQNVFSVILNVAKNLM